MKYEITKGSEKDFDGAPEWATLLLKGRFAAKAWASSYSNGAKALTPGTTDKYIIDAIEDCTIIAERRPITEPVFAVDWLPPVGSRIEYACIKFDENRPAIELGKWYGGTIIAYYDGFVWTSDNGIRRLNNTIFRPMKSLEDVARDEAAKAMAGIANDDPQRMGNASMRNCLSIYDAIAEGKIPGVLLESKAADLKINITTDEMWREFEKKSDMEDVYKLFRERESRRGSF